jgi:thiol:disulfide interchange protein DsbC
MTRPGFTVAMVLLCLLCASALAAGTPPAATWLAGLPLDKAIRIGSGSHVVIEVSDPDCRFSRRMSRYWSMRTDVTRYIFLVALKNHPEAPQKARYILTAADRAAAYREVFSGGLDFDETKLDRHYDDGGLLEVHREAAARLGAVDTPTYFVNGVMVRGAKVSEIEQLLGGEKIPFDVGDADD